MNDELEQLVDEIGGDNPRMGTDYKGDDVYADPMTLDQAKRLSDAAEGEVASTDFSDDDEFFDAVERIQEDWSDVTLLFAGQITEWGYIDAVYVCYEDVIAEWEDDDDYFREYITLHFKHWMRGGPEENEGICPVCDDRIEFSNERFRDDDNLWASPDEFDFREYDGYGHTVRMWWDD